MGIWPAFPIVIDLYSMTGIPPNDEENVIAALGPKHLGRVCVVRLDVTGLQLGRIATTMQEQFSGADMSSDYLGGRKRSRTSRQIFGRISTKFTRGFLIRGSLSNITNASFVGQ